MQEDVSSSKADQPMLGHRLADMSDISLVEALQGKQTLLRLANPSSEELDALAERFTLDELHLTDVAADAFTERDLRSPDRAGRAAASCSGRSAGRRSCRAHGRW